MAPSTGTSSPPASGLPDDSEGLPAEGRSSRKTLLIAVAGVALVLLVGGGLFAWSRQAGPSDGSEEAGAEEPAESSASTESKHVKKHSKPAAKHTKESTKEKKAKHGAKEEKTEGKKGEKKESKSAHAKKPAEESKHAGKEPKGGKAEEKHAKGKPPEAGEKGKAGEGDSPEEAAATEQPVYLGEGKACLGPFSVKIFDPLTRTMLRTDFVLEAVIACEDEAEFQHFLRARLQFFREQVMVAMRTSDAVDFADSSLALVKRRILARVNRALGHRFLKSVELKDFVVYESVDNSPYVRWQPAAAESP